jgi:N-acetylornithine carbamoyltransferase
MSPIGQPARAPSAATTRPAATRQPAPGLAADGAPRHLLSTRDPSTEEWSSLLALAERMTGKLGRKPLLDGLRLGMLMLNPSLRTRTAFELACHDLGAHVVPLGGHGDLWGLEHRPGVVMDGAAAEHVTEAIGALSRLVDGLGVRVFGGLNDPVEDRAEPVLSAIAQAASVPVLNLESAMDHPHQALADALTLRRALPGRRARVVLSWAPHIKPLPLAVAQAALTAFAREGHDVVLTHPPGYELDEGVLADANAFAMDAGGELSVSHDRDVALDGADVVYVKSWGARAHYGRPDAATAGFETYRNWMLTAEDLGDALFMHCLPVRRGVVVADDVLDGGRSLVMEQAANRLHVQKATLCHAFGVNP